MGNPEIEDQISDDDYLIRRISPSRPGMDTIAKNADGSLRASSISMSTRPGEKHLSCSLLRKTTPKELLAQLSDQGTDPDGWGVALIKVGDARKLGIEVKADSTDQDEGHCLLTGQEGLDYPSKAGKKLAKKSIILSDEQISNPESIS